ncbi:uncharacterized protein LOC127750279 [Frankliniella occidentalis]|uniref:Uncharacterized protein LOC127750279 n=1 Tax=Frankliniella occidentalis TaxID=133901 RepID=A0A9C6XQB0_FRAOC|nr:uncharacterized protein LOC127750279 [Frankliniella occidentalis]
MEWHYYCREQTSEDVPKQLVFAWRWITSLCERLVSSEVAIATTSLVPGRAHHLLLSTLAELGVFKWEAVDHYSSYYYNEVLAKGLSPHPIQRLVLKPSLLKNKRKKCWHKRNCYWTIFLDFTYCLQNSEYLYSICILNIVF